jgi:thiol-disulfide isomerase/thioredoxin
MQTPQKPNRPWLSLAIVVLLTAGALYLVLTGTRAARPPASSGEAAPATSPGNEPAPPQAPSAAQPSISPGALYAMSFPGTDGKPLALGKWQGKIIVLNFWATWCVPCREEMPMFDRVHKKFTDKGVVFVGLAADDAAKVAAFMNATPVGYPILIGDFEALEIARRFGNKISALPFTAIIDRAGNIVRTKLGPYTEAELARQIEVVLK